MGENRCKIKRKDGVEINPAIEEKQDIANGLLAMIGAYLLSLIGLVSTSEKQDDIIESFDKNYFIEIARGNIEGQDTEFKFGRSSGIVAVESVIWDGGGTYTFLESAEKINIVSTSINDTLLGDRARTLVIYGLDANHNEIFELVELNGTTPVQTQLSYLRVFRMLILDSGTNDPIDDANEGTISATSVDTTTLQARILPTNGQTLMAVYTIPSGKTGFITGLSASAGQGKQCLFKGKFRNGPLPSNAFSVKFTIDLYENSFYGTLVTPLRVPEKTDIVITGQTTTGTIDASASFGIILIDN